MTDSPVDRMLNQLRASLHARRAEVVQRVDGLERALEAYRTSAEEQIAHEFAVQHGLARPKLGPVNPRQAAEQLYRLVGALPELELSAPVDRTEAVEPKKVAEPLASTPSNGSEARQLKSLVECTKTRKVVVVGAHAGRNKEAGLPTALLERIEWVDTERNGVHAIGNLPQRIRQGRVAAIVILDRAVKHKHTAPLLAAARDSSTPVAFAGKGGQGAMGRALLQLDERLRAEGKS